MISSFFYRFKHLEIIQYLDQVIAIVNKEDVSTLLLTDSLTALNVKLSALQAVYKQTRGSVITKEIEAIDDRRDKAIRGLKTVVTGYTHYFTEAESLAANKLLTVIDKHGPNIARREYNEETAILNTIVKDVEKETVLTEAVTTLHLTNWFNELKESNTLFNTKYLERLDESVENPLANFPELRKEAVNAYYNLVDHIKAHKTLTNTAAYALLLEKIESLAAAYEQTIENRYNTTSETPDTEEPNTEDTTDTAPTDVDDTLA
ncbi:DUF6261 family protein [Tenacibaculum sp. 190524A02b]|uniref:DUF6261 family protein n=1 Tax=Tenacibaculum vairaonense TaxID=3137860 RepID=UPI0031FB617C